MWRTVLNATLFFVMVAGCNSVLLCQSTTPAPSQQATQRLVLKDGSYQAVVKYEVQGANVHYLSAERYEWEDLPSALVDWDATKQYAADLSSGKLRTHVETPEEKEEREREEANSPEVLPGLRLPGTGGVFLLDQLAGRPELAEILQNGSEVNQNQKKSVLRSAVSAVGTSKRPFELKGEHALIQSHVPVPTLYVDIDEGPMNDVPLSTRFRIVRADTKKGVRVIGNLKVSFSGKATEEGNFVPTRVEKVGTGEWVKVIPEKALSAGEYAVVEMLGPDEINLYVWDFGVNPSAPANPNTWRPVPAAGTTPSP